MVLYKYTNHYGLDVLLNSEVKITPFNQLNDPLEITPSAGMRTEEEAKQQLKTPAAFETAKQTQSPGPVNQAEWNDRVDGMTSLELQVVIRNQLDVIKRIPRDASAKFGVLCLSQCPDNILMWSHYSDGHRGMVIGVEAGELPDGGRFFDVDYPPDNMRVEWRPFLRQGDQDFDNYVRKLPRTKGLALEIRRRAPGNLQSESRKSHPTTARFRQRGILSQDSCVRNPGGSLGLSLSCRNGVCGQTLDQAPQSEC